MNGFRITILTLLCLSVGLMFYAVLFVIPSWQGNYNSYQSSLKLAEYEKKNDIHRQQMLAYDPAVEAPEVEKARLEQEAAVREAEASINEAEENMVVAAAKRKEEASRARAARERDDSAANPSSAVIGQVASYDAEWNCVMMKPSVPDLFQPGALLAVRREGAVLCELVVDSRDPDSGQVSATIKETDMDSGSTDAKKREPRAGDEVIVSPFLSAKELMGERTETPVAPVQQLPSASEDDRTPPPPPPPPPADEPEQQPESVPEPQPAEPAHSSEELPSLDDTTNTLEQ